MVEPYRSEDKRAGSASQNLADQAASVGRDIREKAVDLAGSSAETLRSGAAELADTAKDFASQTGETVKQAMNEQKGAGAEYVGNLAGTMRRAAREFESDLPIAATYIRRAASQVEAVSDSVRNGDFNDLIRGAQSFARRQPTAFLGLSVLAGFGVIRFLKSSADTGNQHGKVEASHPMSQNRGRSEYGTTSDSDNRGYRDEFTK